MSAAVSGKYDDDMIDTEEDDSEGDADDDEEAEGESEDEVQENETSSVPKDGSKKKQYVSELYQPPTNDEMQGLKETSELFKSNIFKMEVGADPLVSAWRDWDGIFIKCDYRLMNC